jgi:hypothetical protein
MPACRFLKNRFLRIVLNPEAIHPQPGGAPCVTIAQVMCKLLFRPRCIG